MQRKRDQLYLGMAPGDLDGKPYAKYWNPKMSPLSAAAMEAIARGPVSAPRLQTIQKAACLLDSSFETLETGYTITTENILQVAVLTDMPGTAPYMVDWWFRWHSEEAQRYRLWHPHAHLHAQWAIKPKETGTDRQRYVGQTSNVYEYLGNELGYYAIQFISPSTLGFDENHLADPQEATAICARVGFAAFPVDFGYLVHYVQRVSGGSQMRSRFWIGGPLVAPRGGNLLMWPAVAAARVLRSPQVIDGANLLVHCAEEMAHLASFLPAIYQDMQHER